MSEELGSSQKALVMEHETSLMEKKPRVLFGQSRPDQNPVDGQDWLGQVRW